MYQIVNREEIEANLNGHGNMNKILHACKVFEFFKNITVVV